MKSILYVGATLMIGASIYGFVDYKKTSTSREFINMYKAKDQPTIPETISPADEGAPKKEMIAIEKTIPEMARLVVKKFSTREKKNKTVKSKKISYKLFSRAALDEKIDRSESPVRKN